MLLAISLGAASAGAQTFTGPSSSASPYVEPTADGWAVLSLLTVGDTADESSYRMVGIPDGLGAMRGRFIKGHHANDPKYLTVFMNHELPATSGVIRAHGSTGAFVSQWTIALDSLHVVAGEDLISDVYTWDAATSQYAFAPANPFTRMCSADLPPLSAFFNRRSGLGFEGRLYMNGEETTEGRAFAHVVTGAGKGTSYELPHLGRLAWENSVAHPDTGDRTLVMAMDDSTPGQVYVYQGAKRRNGNPVERAGLVGGRLFGIRVTAGGANYGGPVTVETSGAINGRFTLVNVSDVAVGPAATLESTSTARGITRFARPEDGAWDPTNRNVFYFVTTGADVDPTPAVNFQSSRLYRLTFDDVDDPVAGGRIESIVDARGLDRGTDLPPATVALFDNIAVNGRGEVIVQEDPGGTPYIAKTWLVNPQLRTAVQVLESDRDRFAGAAPLTADEESSGVIEVTNLVTHAWWYEAGRRYYLADMQAHYAITGELVEGGQFYLVAGPRERSRHPTEDDDRDDDEDRR